MKLPEPVRHAWRQHRETLHRIAAHKPGGTLLIGGGTILAARWGHRQSEDIDVLFPERDAIRDTHPGQRNDLAKATGGTVEGNWSDRIKVRVKDAVLDICAMRPELDGLERRITVEDETATVLSTAQILRGKLNRTQQGLARDAFDLITAAKIEPAALQHAVNALDENETHVIRSNLQDANDHIADAAADALVGIPKEFETDTSRLGTDAAEAVKENRYTRVRLSLEADELSIERWTTNGKQPKATYKTSDVAEALLESGIGEYLKANHAMHEAMASQGIAELQRQGRRGPVFDNESSENPARNIEDAAEAAMEHESRELAKRQATPRTRTNTTADEAEDSPSRPQDATNGNAEETQQQTTRRMMSSHSSAEMTPDGGPDSKKAGTREERRDNQAKRIQTAMKKSTRNKRRGPEMPE